jgi:hypothetical protein
MSTTKYLSKTSKLLERFKNRNKKQEGKETKNELIHPRFEISKDDALAQKTVPNSLLFLMYSQENEALFI